MRTSSFGFAILATRLLSGCVKQPEVVYVDLPRAEAAMAQPNVSLPAPPQGQPAATLAFSEMSTGELLLDSRANVARARTLIEQDRRTARRSLQKQYLLARNSDIDDLHQRLLQKIPDVREQLREEMGLELRKRFEAYADERGPKLTRITSLEAYRPYVLGAAAAVPKRQEASELRQEVTGIDAQYLSDRQKIIAKIRAGVDEEQTRIARDVAGLRIQATEQAEAAAAEEMQSSARVPLPMPKSERVQLRPVGTRSIQIPGSPPPASAPAPPTGLPAVSAQERAATVLRQANLWARTSGYVLRVRPGQGRDATEEFLRWMKDRQLGR